MKQKAIPKVQKTAPSKQLSLSKVKAISHEVKIRSKRKTVLEQIWDSIPKLPVDALIKLDKGIYKVIKNGENAFCSLVTDLMKKKKFKTKQEEIDYYTNSVNSALIVTISSRSEVEIVGSLNNVFADLPVKRRAI